jgi:hypothetical protein
MKWVKHRNIDARNAYMLSENPMERKGFRDQAILGRMTLKLIFEKLSVKM